MTRVTLISLLAGLGAGCSQQIVGDWKADPIPRGEPFYVREAAFKADGSFTASAKRGQEDVRLEGKYEYDGTTLVLKPRGRPTRTYPALLWWGRTLELRLGTRKYLMKKE